MGRCGLIRSKEMSRRKKGFFTSGLTKHHSLPSSRNGTDESIVWLPDKFHQEFHYLFGNLTPDEIHKFLDIVLVPGTVWTQKKLSSLITYLKKESEENGTG